ncbi:MAG: hypothetical protein AAF693_21490 [Bacteroidota bacterium]
MGFHFLPGSVNKTVNGFVQITAHTGVVTGIASWVWWMSLASSFYLDDFILKGFRWAPT